MVDIVDTNPDAIVIIDEAYVDYMLRAGNLPEVSSYRRNLVVARSFSKGFGAAGCRVGYLTGSPGTLEKIAKFRPMYELAGPSMLYALFLLSRKDDVENYQAFTISERKAITKFFEKMGHTVIESEGNWIHISQSQFLKDELDWHKIAVRTDVELPLLKGQWIRMTVGPGVLPALKKIF